MGEGIRAFLPSRANSRVALGLALLLLPALSSAAEAEQEFRNRAHHLAFQAATAEDVEAELAFGKSIAARVLGRVPVYDNPQVTRYINLVGKALALHSNRPELEFRFAILDTQQVNAYSAPGGYVFVTRGAIGAMKDEAELAAVLAHEIAHVTERHIVREFNVRASDDSTISSLSRLIGGSQDSARVAFAQAVDKAMAVLFEKGFKHEDELASDRVATLLLAATGYDPMALKRYLERLQSLSEKREQVNTTHPPSAQRLAKLNHLLRSEGLMGLNFPRAAKRFTVNARLD